MTGPLSPDQLPAEPQRTYVDSTACIWLGDPVVVRATDLSGRSFELPSGSTISHGEDAVTVRLAAGVDLRGTLAQCEAFHRALGEALADVRQARGATEASDPSTIVCNLCKVPIPAEDMPDHQRDCDPYDDLDLGADDA